MNTTDRLLRRGRMRCIVPMNSTTASETSRSVSIKSNCDMEDIDVNGSSLNQKGDVRHSNSSDEPRNKVVVFCLDCRASNVDTVVDSGSFSESALLSFSSAVVDLGDMEEIWHFRDDSGEILGPFSMEQLDYYCTKYQFRVSWRIWRVTEKEEDSILLMDALNGKFQKEPPELKTCLMDASGLLNNNIQSSKSDPGQSPAGYYQSLQEHCHRAGESATLLETINCNDAVLMPRSGQLVSPHVPVKLIDELDNFASSHTSERNTQVGVPYSQNKCAAHSPTGALVDVETEPHDISVSTEPCDISVSISVEIPGIIAELPASTVIGDPSKVGTDLVSETVLPEIANLGDSVCPSGGDSKCPKEDHEWCCDSAKKPEMNPRPELESQGWEPGPFQQQNPLTSSVTAHHAVRKQAQGNFGDNLSSVPFSAASSTIANQHGNICSPLLPPASVPFDNHASMLIDEYDCGGNTRNNVSVPISYVVQEASKDMHFSMPHSTTWGMGSEQNSPNSWQLVPETNAGEGLSKQNASMNYDSGLTGASFRVSSQASTNAYRTRQESYVKRQWDPVGDTSMYRRPQRSNGDRRNGHQNKRYRGGYSGHDNEGQGAQGGSYGFRGRQGTQSRICRHHLRGHCYYGQSCLFLHPGHKTTRQDK